MRDLDLVLSRLPHLRAEALLILWATTMPMVTPPSLAAEQPFDPPAWLMTHVGNGEGQIAESVLRRARALYRGKVSGGEIANRCYFAMDATRPNEAGGGSQGRFYIICESEQIFRSIAAGHGSGRDLGSAANFSNGRRCARNFGNALDSELTSGGSYVTAQTKTSFKGYYRASATSIAPFIRSFIQFDGEGATANARAREIGGHAAVALKGVCLRKDPGSPYANPQGYVPFGKLVDYSGGRSNGCTSWSPSDAARIDAMVRSDPTTLYIYPEAKDIHAVAQAVAAHRLPAAEGAYWNISCLAEIGSPRYWPQDVLEPIIARFKSEHPSPPPAPTPICSER